MPVLSQTMSFEILFLICGAENFKDYRSLRCSIWTSYTSFESSWWLDFKHASFKSSLWRCITLRNVIKQYRVHTTSHDEVLPPTEQLVTVPKVWSQMSAENHQQWPLIGGGLTFLETTVWQLTGIDSRGNRRGTVKNTKNYLWNEMQFWWI